MLLNQSVTARRAVRLGAGLACLLLAGGCAATRGDDTPAPDARAADIRQDQAAVQPPETVTDAATRADAATQPAADVPAGTVTPVLADAADAVKASAPKSYVVKRGDTLWGIANQFLRNPWQWPEIWYVNPQIRNPHLIYPGDTVQLAYGRDGRVASLQVVRGPQQPAVRLSPLLRSTALEGPIATIPYNDIGSFLSRPGVLSADEARKLPYVLALRNDHIIAGNGYEMYVKGLKGEAGARYNVMHVDAAVRDPDSGRQLGYLAIYTGTARVVQPGDPAKVQLTQSARETLTGDVLVPEDLDPPADFVPHTPTRKVDGKVAAVVGGVLVAGQYSVVVLNRGSRDGLDRGSVLTAEQAGDIVKDNCVQISGRSDCILRHDVHLPDERSGTLLVFKVMPRLSFALVLRETDPVRVGDTVRSP